MEKYNTGLVLSGGGTRGIAHIGALKALEELGIKPDVISGVSAGALVGALYSSGVSPEKIYDLLCKKEFYNCSNLSFGFKGFMEMTGLRKDLKNHCLSTFESLQIPLFIGATNLNTGQIHYFNSGELLEPLVASASIPILYNPVTIDGQSFIDGGIVDNMPVTPLLNNCQNLIGVNVNPVNETDKVDNIMDIVSRTFQIVSRSNVEGKRLCDVLIEPGELVDYSFLNNAKAREVFDIGYHTTMDQLRKFKLNRKMDFPRNILKRLAKAS